MFKTILLAACGLLGTTSIFGAAALELNRPSAGKTVEVLVQYVRQPSYEVQRRLARQQTRRKPPRF